jgi:hypothetical protein
VSGANYRPLAFDLIEPADQELSEAPSLLDLTEHRLNDRFLGRQWLRRPARFRRKATALIRGNFGNMWRPAASASS